MQLRKTNHQLPCDTNTSKRSALLAHRVNWRRMFVGAWLSPELVGKIILLASGGLMLLLACCLRQLKVSNASDFGRHVLRYYCRDAA